MSCASSRRSARSSPGVKRRLSMRTKSFKDYKLAIAASFLYLFLTVLSHRLVITKHVTHVKAFHLALVVFPRSFLLWCA